MTVRGSCKLNEKSKNAITNDKYMNNRPLHIYTSAKINYDKKMIPKECFIKL